MIYPNADSLTSKVVERPAVRESWIASQARRVFGWLGFFLLCAAVGGEEVRRQGKKSLPHIRTEE